MSIRLRPPIRIPSRPDEAVLRFIQEARAASALNHPNIVTVSDIGKIEQVEGETPRRALVSKKALSLRTAATSPCRAAA